MNSLFQVLNWRVVDSDLAIGLCTILPKAAVVDILWKMITSAWQNYEKIKVNLKFGLSFISCACIVKPLTPSIKVTTEALLSFLSLLNYLYFLGLNVQDSSLFKAAVCIFWHSSG